MHSAETKRKISEAIKKAHKEGRGGPGKKFTKGYDPRRVNNRHPDGCKCVAHGGAHLRGPGPAPFGLETLTAKRCRVNGQTLKTAMIRDGIKEDKCEACGQLPTWNGRLLVIQLDHLDGDKTNNAISNLRLVCPNCHSQTDTFAGRNRI